MIPPVTEHTESKMNKIRLWFFIRISHDLPLRDFLSEHFSWFYTIGSANNTLLFHHFNHSGSPVVTYSEPSLQHRDGSLPGFQNELDGFLVFFVELIL